MKWLQTIFKSKVGRMQANSDDDEFLSALVDDKVRVRKKAALALSGIGLEAFQGTSASGLAQAYAKTGMLVEMRDSEDPLKESILRFVFCRALLDPEKEVREHLAYALYFIDSEWAKNILKCVKFVEKGASLLSSLGDYYLPLQVIGLRFIPSDLWDASHYLKRSLSFREYVSQEEALRELNEIQERFLGGRTRDFREWFDKASSRPAQKGPVTTSDLSAQIQLLCTGCGKRFCLGRDAVVSSPEGVLRDFAVAITVGKPTAPDLVAHGRWDALDEPTRCAQLAAIRLILDATQKRQGRQWKCKNCGKVQEYGPL